LIVNASLFVPICQAWVKWGTVSFINICSPYSFFAFVYRDEQTGCNMTIVNSDNEKNTIEGWK